MKKLMPLVAIAAGLLLILVLMLTRSRPRMEPSGETGRLVMAVKIQPVTVVPWVTTYGEVSPERTWTAVAQVSGKAVSKSPRLKDGEFVRAGDELLRIDDQEYKLAISRSQADVEKINARLAELESNRDSLGRQVSLLAEAVEFTERELARQRDLFEQKAVSRSAVEQQEIASLEQRRSLANLRASHDALPAQIDYQKAELDAARASLQQAELNLAYTVIEAPFNGRIDATAVETDQYIPAGQTLFQLDSIDRAEISVGVTLANLAMLAGSRVTQVVETIAEQRSPRPENRPAIQVIQDVGNERLVWEGSMGRIGAAVDPATRMAEMVVMVDRPYQRRRPPRPPLSKGSFCRVVMHGRPQNDRLVVPRNAVHEGRVYVVGPGNRLEIRAAEVDYHLGKYSVLLSGVEKGDVLVTSDLVPAVPGMLLEPRLDESFFTQAAQELGPREEPAEQGAAAEPTARATPTGETPANDPPADENATEAAPARPEEGGEGDA